jgi:hypothetical protein
MRVLTYQWQMTLQLVIAGVGRQIFNEVLWNWRERVPRHTTHQHQHIVDWCVLFNHVVS